MPDSTPSSLPVAIPVDVSNAMQLEAEAYVAEHGVSIDEAIERVSMMEASGALNAKLEQHEPETFAGLWMFHQPEFRVIAAFTRDGESILSRYVENTILAGVIETRQAAVSQAELYSIERETHQILERLSLSLIALTLVNIKENQVEIHISDQGLLENRLVEAGLELPDHVAILGNQVSSTGESPPNLTPALGIHFPQLIAPPSVVYALSVVGELILKNGCLRMTRSEGDPGELLVWHPGYYLNDNQGAIEVLADTGRVSARVGEVSCFSPAAGEVSRDDASLMRNPLPGGCPGPEFLVGDVQLAFQVDKHPTLVKTELVRREQGDFYFLSLMEPFQEGLDDPRTLTGNLVLSKGSRCIRLQRETETGFQDYLVLWPPGYSVQQGSGPEASDNDEIINGQGEMVAQLNGQVRLHGSLVLALEETRLLLNEDLPCDCAGGDYWLVIDNQHKE